MVDACAATLSPFILSKSGVAPPPSERLLRLQQGRGVGHQWLHQFPLQVRLHRSLQSINQLIASPLSARLPTVFTLFLPRFMGNSSAAIMDGEAVLYFLRLPGESYTITFPTAYARGALPRLLSFSSSFSVSSLLAVTPLSHAPCHAGVRPRPRRAVSVESLF